MSRLKISTIFACLLLIAASCGSSDDISTGTGDTPEAGGGGTTGVETAAKPVIVVPDGEPPTELLIEDIVIGDGAEAVAGTPVSVDYVGVAYSNATEFDASWDRGSEFRFSLGVGQVIPGWDEGVQGMKVGGRRQLTIPPEMAYGTAGAGGAIGPNETLIFVVDLRSVG